MKFKKLKFLLFFSLLCTFINTQGSSSVFDIIDNTESNNLLNPEGKKNDNYRFAQASNNGTPPPIVQPSFTNKPIVKIS